MLLCEAMHKIQKDFPLYSHDLPPSLVCNENFDDCWNNKCDECKGGKRFIKKFPLFDTSVEITWYQWEKKLMASRKEQLCSLQWPNINGAIIPTAFFIKQTQSDSYMKLKKQAETNDSTAVLQIVFAEFYYTFW